MNKRATASETPLYFHSFKVIFEWNTLLLRDSVEFVTDIEHKNW